MLRHVKTVEGHDEAPAPVGRRAAVGATDDAVEREADDVSAIVTSLLDRPAAVDAPATRIRRRVEVPVVRRKLTEMAVSDDIAVVKEHVKSTMDTGRTYFEEAKFIYLLNELVATPDTGLRAKCSDFVKANKGSDPAALSAAINALATEANAKYDSLMTALSTLRDDTSDTSDALRSHFSGSVIKVGKDEQMLDQCNLQLRQAVFKEDPFDFVVALATFRDWLKKQDYKWYFDEFAEGNRKAIAEDSGPAEDEGSPGIVTLAELRKVAPAGTTGGQRYTPDRSLGAWRYHVSISFKVIDTKANLKLAPTKKKVEISQFHVSFEPSGGGAKVFYWWRQQGKKGNYVFNNVAGASASATVAMRNAADSAVANAAPEVRCTA